MKSVLLLSLAAIVAATVSCSDATKPDDPWLHLIVAPKDTTVDYGSTVVFRVTANDGAPLSGFGLSAEYSRPVVASDCGDKYSFNVCVRGVGTSTVTFRTTDGRSGIGTVHVLEPRFIAGIDTPLVVAHATDVWARWTGNSSFRVHIRVTTPDVVSTFLSRDYGDYAPRLTLLRPGTLGIVAFLESDTTIRQTFSFPVEAQRTTSIRLLSPPPVTRGQGSVSFSVAMIDQRNGIIHGTPPAITITGGDAVARITSVTSNPTATDSVSAVVAVAPASAGTTVVHVSADGAVLDVPLQLAAVADDSLRVTSIGGSVDVASNDAKGASAFRVIKPPAHGVAAFTGSVLRFDPSAAFIGADSLTYAATADGRTDTATVRLGALPGPFTAANVTSSPADTAVDLNDVGMVAGRTIVSDGTRRALRWTTSRVDTLQFNGRPTSAIAIDNAGNVLGAADPSTDSSRIVYWPAGTTVGIDLALPRGYATCCVAMSSGGTIVAGIGGASYPSFRYVLIRGARRDTVTSGGYGAIAVDDAGDFLGQSPQMYGQPIIHYADGHEGSSYVGRGYFLRAMNNHAIAVAGEVFDNNVPLKAVEFGAGVSVDLTARYGLGFLSPSGINDSGWVLGASGSDSWLLANGAADKVSSLLADRSMSLISVTALNNAGQLLAVVRDAGGVKRTVILTPPTH